jgi:hypothetical protein
LETFNRANRCAVPVRIATGRDKVRVRNISGWREPETKDDFAAARRRPVAVAKSVALSCLEQSEIIIVTMKRVPQIGVL